MSVREGREDELRRRRFETHACSISLGAAWRRVRRPGLLLEDVFRAAEQDRPDVARERKRRRLRQRFLDPDACVLIDETGASTKMTRPHV